MVGAQVAGRPQYQLLRHESQSSFFFSYHAGVHAVHVNHLIVRAYGYNMAYGTHLALLLRLTLCPEIRMAYVHDVRGMTMRSTSTGAVGEWLPPPRREWGDAQTLLRQIATRVAEADNRFGRDRRCSVQVQFPGACSDADGLRDRLLSMASSSTAGGRMHRDVVARALLRIPRDIVYEEIMPRVWGDWCRPALHTSCASMLALGHAPALAGLFHALQSLRGKSHKAAHELCVDFVRGFPDSPGPTPASASSTAVTTLRRRRPT